MGKPPASAAKTRAAASIQSVAERANVSTSTVSRIINGIAKRASPETVRRVQEAIDFLQYRPQSAGRALRQRKSRIVGVLVSNLGNPAMAAIAASIEAGLRAQGFVMSLCDTHEDPVIQDEYLREMDAQLARAVVLVVAVESPALRRFRREGRPLVFVSRRDPGGAKSSFVGIDDYKAGRTVAAYCAEEGYRYPAILHASVDYSAGALRLKGIRDELVDRGWDIRRAPDFGGPGRSHLEIGFSAAEKAFAEQPRTDVFICLSDLIAFGAFRWCAQSAGPVRPRLFGFDDNPLNDWISPWLSSIRPPYEMIGETVAAAVCDLFEGRQPRRYLLPHKLVIRGK